MLARVRRGDLALTAVALIGLAAGMVLTVAKVLGLTGPVLIGAGIAAAAAALVQGVRSQVAPIKGLDTLQRRRLDAILAVRIQPIGQADPFTIGVFRSILAERAQRDPPKRGETRHVAPPYVPRNVDAALRRALEESSLAAAGRLVVLRGDPKAGKSRSLWEAVRTLPGRRLLAVAHPDLTATDTDDPAYAPLATLAGLERPVSGSKGSDLVIWVDDAHSHLGRGLSGSILRRLDELYPEVVIAVTIHAYVLEKLRDIDPDLHKLLRQPFDELFLDPWLKDAEVGSARGAYPALADNPDLVRLPELFAAVDLLIDRYRHHRTDQPAGVAVAKAAIDWQRAGMPPGSIDESSLRALAEISLADIAPNREMDDQAFKRGLDWACNEVAAYAALVRRERTPNRQARRFGAFDAVVWWAHRHEPPVSRHVWDFVLAHVSIHDVLSVGIAAYLAKQWCAALSAFQSAAGSTSPPIRAAALIGVGITLGQLGRHEEELAAFDQVVESFVTDGDRALTPYVTVALVNKGSRLRQLQWLDELAVNDRMIERFVTSGPSRRDHPTDRIGEPGASQQPNEPSPIIQLIYLLSEEFLRLHLPNRIEAFRARWPALNDLPPEDLAWLRERTSGPPGLGYGRPDEVDGIVGVIAWFVVASADSRIRRSRIRRAHARIRRVADRRHLRPEVSDALARFLSGRLDNELPGGA